MNPGDWSFGELVERALEAGASKLHLAVGAPPMMRLPGEGVFPVGEGYGAIEEARLAREFSVLVAPERWSALESDGSGEVSLLETYGMPWKMTLYKVGGRWAAVVHLT